MSDTKVRELELEEWKRLFEIPALKEVGALPNPATHRCVVVEADGKIVGCWFLFTALHAEPLWVDERYRHRKDVAGQLWPVMEEMVSKTDYTGVFMIISNAEEAESIRRMAKKLNFRKYEGSLWTGVVKGRVKES